jgi:hypothetical protein
VSHTTHPKKRGVRSVEIRVIDGKEQRYPTSGDWEFDAKSGHLLISVSRTGDWREEQSVAFHEFCEALLCIQRGVTQESVDEFDMHFEEARDPQDESEPGDDPRAPYYLEHQIATIVEHLLATHLGLHWPTYNAHVGSA